MAKKPGNRVARPNLEKRADKNRISPTEGVHANEQSGGEAQTQQTEQTQQTDQQSGNKKKGT